MLIAHKQRIAVFRLNYNLQKHKKHPVWLLGLCLSWYKVSLLLLHKPDWRKGRKNGGLHANPLCKKTPFFFFTGSVQGCFHFFRMLKNATLAKRHLIHAPFVLNFYTTFGGLPNAIHNCHLFLPCIFHNIKWIFKTP